MNSLCSHERLERALAGLLNADDESRLYLHLDECELCAAEMERLAGGERASQEIASMLIPDDLDDALPLREECSTADFVVEHLEPSDDPEVLGRLGSYDVLDVIGRGGMGVVLRGFDRELKRFVAIKALAPHLAHSALARKRFAREAQAAAAVVNLHVIAIHQVQPNGQLPFLVMPLLNGESLAQRMTARGTLELKEVLRIGMQAAEGLAAAHGQGLIHRDVKPANILLEKGVERAVLTDFGLARAADDVSMSRWGIIAGTPEYMSPEQVRGEALDGRSDLFSFGCVMYEMATGVSPFRTDSTMATLRRIVDEKPAAMASLVPELRPWFIGIVERLLSKDPAGRFASASEVSQLLEQCLSHLQQPTMVSLPKSIATPNISRSGRPPLVRLLVAAAFAFALILAGVFFVLELNKGQLTIQCAADDVPIRIRQGDTVVKKLTVTKAGATVRVAAGNYVVEVDGVADGIVVQEGAVSLKRGDVEIVHIVHKPAATSIASQFPGMTESIADAILDWVDDDNDQRPFGAEAETYLQSKSLNSPPNRPLKHINELFGCRGITPELLYGADTNRNGIIDAREDDSVVPALGWAGLIRANQAESTTRKEAGLSEVDRALFALATYNPRVDKFAELDTDQDGQLSLAEFGVGRKSKDAAKWFKLRDADHDDFLSPAEFVPLSASSVAHKQPAETLDGKAIDRKNARVVVEAYVTAVLDGDPPRAQSFAKGNPAEPQRIETTARVLNVKRLAMKSVFVNDPAKPTIALATSDAVTLEEKQPNGQRDGFLVFTLTMSDEGWFVTDIDFESEEGADRELKRFLEANPKTIGMPPLNKSAGQDEVSTKASGSINTVIYVSPPAIAQKLVISDEAWGPPVDGVQAGFLMSDIVSHDSGSMFFNGAIVIKNVSDQPIAFTNLGGLEIPELFDADGNRVGLIPSSRGFSSLYLGALFHKGMTVKRRILLKPGEQYVLDRECELAIVLAKQNGEPIAHPWTWESCAAVHPGTYTACCGLSLTVERYMDADGNIIKAFPAPRGGDLQTGKVALSLFEKPVRQLSENGMWGLSEKDKKSLLYNMVDGRRQFLRAGQFEFGKRDGLLRVFDTAARFPVLTYRKTQDNRLTADESDAVRIRCARSLFDTTDGTLRVYDLCTGDLLVHFAVAQGGEIESIPTNLKENQESTSQTHKLDRRDARTVVEAYLAMALAGDVAKAGSFEMGNPAEPKQIETIARVLNVKRLAMKSVYVNDSADPTLALATSDAVTLEEKQPSGQRDGFLVLTLTMSEVGWCVTDIDFESEEGADGELKRFLKAHPKAIGLPPFEKPAGRGDSPIPDANKPAAKATGKQLGTVLGKPVLEGELNKNVSSDDNLERLLLRPLMERYCQRHGLDRAEELKAKIKDEKSRRMASFFVLRAELNRHLYEKHGGRVILSAFGPIAFDGMRKWLQEREQAGEFEFTDPQLKTKLVDFMLQELPGDTFASPDQIKAAFDPAITDRYIENFAKIPASHPIDANFKIRPAVPQNPVNSAHPGQSYEIP